MNVFANAIIRPVPDFEVATQREVIAWGACMSMSAVMGGSFLIRCYRSKSPGRVGWLLLFMSLGFFLGVWIFATRPTIRQFNERMRIYKEQSKASGEANPDPGGTP